MFRDVIDFHRKMGIPFRSSPGFLAPAQLAFRMAYMMEELGEFSRAHVDNDLVRCADALADLVYFALGTAVQMGIPFEQVWIAVHRSNMTKLPGVDKYGNYQGANKPDTWESPHGAIDDIVNGELKI